jgi:hypothetical protein
LTIANADGSTKGLKIGSTLMTADATELNYLDTASPGTVIASKAVVADSNKDVGSFRNLTATNVTGTLQTAAQPNVTSVGTLSSLSVAGNVTVGSTTLSQSEVAVIEGVTAGTAAANKAVVLDANKAITGIGAISTGSMTITPSGSLLFGATTIVESEMAVIDSVTPGAASASKALVVDGSKNITGVGVLTATGLNTTTLTVGTTSIVGSEIAVVDGVVAGTAAASKALVLDSSRNVTNINSITSTAYVGSTVTLSGYGIIFGSFTTVKATSGLGGLAYAPSLNMYVAAVSTTSTSTYYTSSDGATWTQQTNLPQAKYWQDCVWMPNVSTFVMIGGSTLTGGTMSLYSSNGLTWTSTTLPITGANRATYSATYGGVFCFNNDGAEYAFTADGMTWIRYTLYESPQNTLPSFTDIGNGIILGTALSGTTFIYLQGGVVGNMTLRFSLSFGSTVSGSYAAAYSPSLDRAVILAGSYFSGSGMAAYKNNVQSTSIATGWQYTNLPIYGVWTKCIWIEEHKVFVAFGWNNPCIMVYSNDGITWTQQTNISGSFGYSLVWDSTNSNLFVVTQSADIKRVPISSNGARIQMGSTTINEAEIKVLDAVTVGTAAASKALTLDANKSVSGITTLSSANLISTAGNLTMGATSLIEDEIKVLDNVTPGVVASLKAVVVDGNKDVSSFRNLTAVTLASTSGSLQMGATNISESDIGVVDNVTPGTAAAFKAVVLDTNKDISGINALSASGLTSTAGSLTMGATSISESEIKVLDGVVAGVASASQAVILDVNKNVSGVNAFSAATLTSTAGSLTMGTTELSEAEVSVLDQVVPGVVSLSKAVVVDSNKDISSFHNLTATNLTGTLQTIAQPNVTSVGTLDSLQVAGNITTASNVVIGSTVLTETKAGYLVDATVGTATASHAIVTDVDNHVSGLHSLSTTNVVANNITGTLQTAAQPNVTSVNVLDVTGHDGVTQGLKLGSDLLTATANQINAIFGAGGEGTFTKLTVADMGLTVGSTLVTASAQELNYVNGALQGTAVGNKALVVDTDKNIAGINSLAATSLTGTLQTSSQPNITSVGTLTSIATSGSLTMGTTVIGESELQVLDAVIPGVVSASSAVVVDEFKDISSFRNLTAVNVTGTLQTAAQANVTSVGNLDSLEVVGDVTIGGSLTVGSTIVAESEFKVIDQAAPGEAAPIKAMITNAQNSISGINALSAISLTGTIQTAAQPYITSVGDLDSLEVVGNVNIGGSLTVGSTIIAENELKTIDQAQPGMAFAQKAMVTDVDNSIAGINSLTATSLTSTSITGTLQTAIQPYVTSVSVLDVSSHDGSSAGLKLGGALVTASATEINYVDTTVGEAHSLKALVLDANKNITGINDISVSKLLGVAGSFSSIADATSIATGAITTEGGVGIAKTLHVGLDGVFGGDLIVFGSASLTDSTESTSASTGSFTTLGGVGIAKSVSIGGDVAVSGDHTQAGVSWITNETDSTSATTGSLTTVGGVGIGKSLHVAANTGVGGALSVGGNVLIDSVTASTSPTTGSVVTAGGVGIKKSLFVGEDVHVVGACISTDSTDSGTPLTGALTTLGGVGIGKNLNVGANAAVSGTLQVEGVTTQVGPFNSTSVVESTSVSTGAIVTTGGVGIAKSIHVGGDAFVSGALSVSGSTTQVGDASLQSLTQSVSPSTGSLTTLGGVGVAMNLNVGGSTTLADVLTISDNTESTSPTVGSVVIHGGMGVAKNMHIGGNTGINGNVSIVGDLSQTGVVSVSNETNSSSITTGSIVTAGGVGVSKNVNIGGVTKLVNTTSSVNPTTGALIVTGGVGVGNDLNIGGDVNVSGDVRLVGDMRIDGELKSTNLNLLPDGSSPFSVTPLVTVVNTNALASINRDAGIGYIHESNAIITAPSQPSVHAIIYYVTNGVESTWQPLALTGDALAAYTASYNNYTIDIRQVYVSEWSNKIWAVGSFYKSEETTSIAIVLQGTSDDGMNTLYTVGSSITSSADVKCTRIAVASGDNTVAVVKYVSSTESQLCNAHLPIDSQFSVVQTDAFVNVRWLNGLGKFVATRNGTSSTYTSTDMYGSIWVPGSTPSSVAPNTAYFNTTMNLAIAVGPRFIWYSTNGYSWLECTYPSLATGDTFGVVANSPVSDVLAIYASANNSVKQVYYSQDAINWLTSPMISAFGQGNSVIFDSINYGYAIGVQDSNTVIQRIGPITSAFMIYKVDVTSGYLKNSTAIGYEWFNSTTSVNNGDLLMKLDSTNLKISPIIDITNSTNSTSVETGSITTIGGAGIAKNLTVGGTLSLGGSLIIGGSTTHAGTLRISNSADSISPQTGALTTSGGVGISKGLSVGTSVTIGSTLDVLGSSSFTGLATVNNDTDATSFTTGSLTTHGGVGVAKSIYIGKQATIGEGLFVNGPTTLVGTQAITNTTEATSFATGSFITAGGIGIAKNINVGTNAVIAGQFTVSGVSTLSNTVNSTDTTESSSSTTGAIKISGGVGIAKKLFVGSSANVGGDLTVEGVSIQKGLVSVTNSTDAVSTSTASFVTAGGVGIGKSLFVGGSVSLDSQLAVSGAMAMLDVTNAVSPTTGSITAAGGVGIAKSLYVGDGFYGVIQTPAQPNISSVTSLNITSHDSTQGLQLGGSLVTSTASELNYLHGSVPGSAVAGKALVVNGARDVSGIEELTATKVTGILQTPHQPLVTSVDTLNIATHDSSTVGLSLGGVLLLATSTQLNNLVAGTSSSTFANATITQNMTISGHNGSTAGLILGSTLVTATGDELNYLDTTKGSAEPNKALVFDSNADIVGINALTAQKLTGIIQTASQPLITSVSTLDITAHNGTLSGLSLNGTLITATGAEINYLDTTKGSAEADKVLVLDSSKSIAGINVLTATSLSGTLQTAAQPKITSLGTLASLAVAGDITVGSIIVSSTDIAKIDDIVNGFASANKAVVLNANKDVSGINKLSMAKATIGSPANSDLLLEVGGVEYMPTFSYAYTNSYNAHGITDAGEGTTGLFSARFDGRVVVTSEIQVTSDARLKQNVQNLSLDYARRFMKESRPVSFNWKSGDTIIEYGFIAQEIYKSNFTDMVVVTPHPGLEKIVDEDGFVHPADAKFTVATGKIIPLLTLTTNELYEKDEQKDIKIAELEARILALETMIATIIHN